MANNACTDELTLSLNEQAFHDTITSLKSFAGNVLPFVVRRNIARTYWRYFDIRQAEGNLDDRSRVAYRDYLLRIRELATRKRHGGVRDNSPGRRFDFDVCCKHPNDWGYERVVYDRNSDGTQTHYYKPVLSDGKSTAMGTDQRIELLREQRFDEASKTSGQTHILRGRSEQVRRGDVSLAVDPVSYDNQEGQRRDGRDTVTSVGVVVGEEEGHTFSGEQLEDWIDSVTTSSTPGISRTSYDLSIVGDSSVFFESQTDAQRVCRSELQRLLDKGIRDDETLRRAAKRSRISDDRDTA